MLDGDQCFELVEGSENAMKVFEKFMNQWALDNKDDVFEALELDWCDDCEEFVEVETHTESGQRGHIDNWEPDTHLSVCCQCERVIAEG